MNDCVDNYSSVPNDVKMILQAIFAHPNSFIVRYPNPRPNNAHTWFVINDPGSKESAAISNFVGQYLVGKNWIVPELTDEEYQIQIALGSIDCRVYKIVGRD